MKKPREELQEMLSREPFVPFVITASDGFAVAVGSPKRALVGLRMLVIANEIDGRLYHFPFTGISHISEAA